MRITSGISLSILACTAVWGQTALARQEFEVASIRPSGPLQPGQLGIGLHVDGAQVRATYLSLVDYIAMSFKVRSYQVSGADWMASDRFNISAKLPDGATREQVPIMLQALLENRFQLKMHHETRPFPVYDLVVLKGGLKMKELAADPADRSDAPKTDVDVKAAGSRAGVSINLGKGSSFTFANNKLEAKKLSMVQLADMLARFVDRPVLDKTDLAGNYEFTLEVAPEDFLTMTIRSAVAAGVQLPPEALHLLDGASESSFHAALQAVGLKLEPRKEPLDMLVIDHAEKNPTEN